MGIEQLVESAAKGDERAWKSLARHLGPKLRRWFASHYGGLEPGDLIQDTLIIVWDKLSTFEMRGEAPFMRWVFAIARLVALEALRELKKEQRSLEATMGLPRAPATGLNTQIDRARRRELVRREIDRLPNSLRLAANNMLDEDRDAKQLAEDLGLSWGTIRGYETRAIDALRVRISDSGTPTPPSRA